MSYEINTYCGLDCNECDYRERCNCGGCIATKGKPFHGECKVANCAIEKNRRFCGECADFPCELLNSYSYDKEQGDDGARIQHCRDIKHALVAQARAGLDPIGYCSNHCDHCFLGEFCGGCRSDYDCCSYATICPGRKCPNVICVKQKGLDGCWECDELDGCEKGFFGTEEGYFTKGSALFVRARGKAAYSAAQVALEADGREYLKSIEGEKTAQNAMAFLEKYHR